MGDSGDRPFFLSFFGLDSELRIGLDVRSDCGLDWIYDQIANLIMKVIFDTISIMVCKSSEKI